MDFKDFYDLGISTVPLKDKRPIVKWAHLKDQMPTETELDEWTSKGYDVGVICGEVSGNLYCLDFDSKNSLSEEPEINEWSRIVKGIDSTLLNKLLLARTINNGYHVIYRVEEGYEVEGNIKLASRLPQVGETEKQIVLVETRGTGGQFACYPIVKNSWDTLPTITMEEHILLLDTAKSLNQVVKEPRDYEKTKRDTSGIGGTSPFDAYDSEIDVSVVLNSLINDGWSIAQEIGPEQYHLIRPGKTIGVSASLNVIPGRFYVFTTSSVFEPDTCYKPSAVYAMLNHAGDYSAAARDLSLQGYGERVTEHKKSELIDKMLGKDKLELTTTEEQAVLSRIVSAEQSMQNYLDFVTTSHNFQLSDNFKHLLPMFKDINPSHVVGYASSSGVGKTSGVRQIMRDYLECTDQYGLFASLEMSNRDLALRNSMEESTPHVGNYVDKDIVTDKLVSDKKFRDSVVKKWNRIDTLDSAYDIDVIFEMVGVYQKYLKRQGKHLGCVAIDFLQLANGGHSIDKQPELAQKLKMYAKKYDVVVFALLQLNGMVDKFEEPNENNVSGHGATLQALDFLFMAWKNATDKNRIIIKNAKERWALDGKCDLVQHGMKIHSEEHQPVEDSALISMNGNRGLKRG